ncbi:hypothetical protein R9N72_13145, partial [Escherichia coli]
MQLNHIVKSLLITGLFTTSSLPLLAAEAPKDATAATQQANNGNDSNLLIVFYVQIMPDDFVMQLHR